MIRGQANEEGFSAALPTVHHPVALTPLCNVAVAPRSAASLLSLLCLAPTYSTKRDGQLKAGFTFLLKLGPICQHSLIHIHTIIVSHTKASSW